jgi:bifunctional non-homologous end joining protein LigD
MKAQLVASMPAGNWIYEIKFDGYRALALRGGSDTRILSRNQKDLGKKFTKIRDAIAALDIQDAIIDGEIVALDDKGRPSFQLLQAFDMAWCGHRSFSTLLICYSLTAKTFAVYRLKSERQSWPLC